MWHSKLYTCMDLKKFDDAIQTCLVLIDLKAKRNEKEGVPHIEEKVVKALVPACIAKYEDALQSGDIAAVDSAKRTVSRVRNLLSKLLNIMKESWLYEVSAYFNERVGRSDKAVEDLMKEYRSLISYRGWESDKSMLEKIVNVVTHISEMHFDSNDGDALKKLQFLLKGIIRKIKAAYVDHTRLPTARLEELERISEKIDAKLA